MNQRGRSLVCLALALSFTAPAWADDKPAGAKPAKPAAEKPEFPPFDESMKDFEKVQPHSPDAPFFTLWYNKKKDSLRAQLPSSLIGQKFLIASTISGGPVATGFQLDDYLAYLERKDKELVLMRVDPRYVEGGSNPVADVVKRSYGGDIIVRTIPILTMKGGDPVIDLDGVLKADFAGIGGLGGGAINPALSKWAKYKTFPQNVEIAVDLAMMQRRGGQRMQFHYSFSKIPDSANGYQPRKADDRIGYFMTVRKDWTKGYDASTLFDRYVNRWRLEKRDPSAELSAPKNPIVWHIEKTVPLKYRRWVKEGILEWNKAFERCGFLDAIEVIQQEDYDPRTKDLDPEDVRHNFFRWIVTGRAFAMGPSRAHPLTGQIFDADIVFDDAMARVYENRYKTLTGSTESWEPFNPYMQAFFRAYPQWQYRSPRELLLPGVQLEEKNENDIFYENLVKEMYQRGRPVCECASGMAHQMQFAGLALEAKGLGRNGEEFMGQLIKEVVMHEVGHCLGLRHNFKSSTWRPFDEVLGLKDGNEANVGSVMDYNPPVVAPRGMEQGDFVTRTIGPYDYWAIEYGYRPAGKPYKDENDMLAQIGQRVADAGLDYATDEDTLGFISPDPLSNRYDMGRDTMDYAKHQIKLVGNLLSDIEKWAVKDGESYTKLRRAFMSIVSQRALVVDYVARFPGGQVINRDHKGDPNGREPIAMIEPAKQREALKFVCENVFAENSYEVSPKLLAMLAPGRYSHWESDEFDFFVEFNIHDFVATAQSRCLTTLMNPFTIGRIHDNQVKFANGDVYSLGEHITCITDSIWAELDEGDRDVSESKPFINTFRRNLQRRHIDTLMELVLTKPGTLVPADANSIARLTMGKLSKKIEKVLSRDLDIATEAHLTDVKTRVDKAMEAQYSAEGNSFPFGFMFMRTAEQEPAKPVTVLPSR